MKKFFGYMLASLVGGCLVLFGNFYINPSPEIHTSVHEKQDAQLVSHKSNLVTTPSSFTIAAEKATPSVVKIKTIIGGDLSQNQQQQQQPQTMDDLFEQFFGGQGFGMPDLFGQMPHMGPQAGSGSGVIISRDGYIATNNHVIDGGTDFEIILDDKRTFRAELVGKDPRVDLAVLKIEAADLPAISYANSNDLAVGQWVLAIGNPFEYLTSTVTAGIISAIGRDINILPGQNDIEAFIQTDAAINPGNSGGALVNTSGELIGINTAIVTQTGSYAGYSFAIPVNLMKKITNDIIQYGSYKRAVLGVEIATNESEVLEATGMDTYDGVFIKKVFAGSAAERAGLLPQDIIVEIEGQKVQEASKLLELLGSAEVGEIISVKVLRDNKEKLFTVKLQEEG